MLGEVAILGALRREAARAGCSHVLASGGVDSSLVAWAVKEALGEAPTLIHVQYLESPGGDIRYVRELAEALGAPLVVRWVSRGEARRLLELAVLATNSFNPMEVINCAAVVAGLEPARRLGARRVCTGDGGDELFVGYSYMLAMPMDELARYVEELPKRWYFCSLDAGRVLGVEVDAPMTHSSFVELALSIPVEEKARMGGKYPLRRALERVLPRSIAWRGKAPIEAGSGFSAIYNELGGVDGARAALRRIFERLGLTYPRGRERPCPICGAELSESGYCRVCGYYAGAQH